MPDIMGDPAERADLYRRLGVPGAKAQEANPESPGEQEERAALYAKLDSLTPAAKLQKARAEAANWQGFEGAAKLAEHLPGVGMGRDIGRRMKYRRAAEAINEGRATDEDYRYFAHMERLDELESSGTTGQKLGRALLKVPAMAAEFAAAGPVLRAGGAIGGRVGAIGGRLGRPVGQALGTGLASSPFMGAIQDAQNRARIDNSNPTDLKNAAPAVGMATLHGAVIGRLQQKLGNAATVRALLTKAPIAGGTGVLEKQAADTVGGLVDQMLPENAQMGQKFGLLGKLARGETDAAAASALIDFTTFTAFAYVHGGAEAVGRTREGFKGILQEGQKTGIPPADMIAKTTEFLHGLRNENPDMLASEAKKHVETMPEPLRKPLEEIIDATFPQIPEQTKVEARIGPGGQPGVQPGWKYNPATRRFEPPPAVEAVPENAPESRISEPAAEPGKTPAETEIAQPETPGEEIGPVELKTGDRRQDEGRRKRIAEMSAEEARKELLTARLEDEHGNATDLPIPNARGFQEAELERPAPAKGFSDSDGLKALNDTFGYSAGNAMLAAKARILKELGIDAYHQKGDEFIYRGENDADLRGKLEQARERLRETEFEVTGKDGSIRRFKGADFSFGVGKDLKTASEGMKAHKQEREAKGERGPRASLGRIVEVGQGGQVPARGAGPGSETTPAEAPTTAPKTLLDRLRARQQTTPAKPQYSPRPEPQRIDVQAEFDKAGLTEAERHVLGAVLRGGDLREIAADPATAKVYGREPSHETIRNLLTRAGKKLGDPRIRETIDKVVAQDRADRAADLIERGGRAAEELLGDADAVRAAKERLTAQDEAQDAIDAFTEKWLKEAERGLSPERQTELDREAAALGATYLRASTGNQAEAAQASPVARQVEGKAPGTAPERAGNAAAEPAMTWKERLAFNGADLSDPAAVRASWSRLDTNEKGDFARQVGSVYQDATPLERAAIRRAFLAAVPDAAVEGKQGEVQAFDATLHDSGEQPVLPGQPVRVQEPALTLSGHLGGTGRFMVAKARVAPERAGNAGLLEQLRAARDTGLMPPGTPDELSSRVPAGRQAVNALVAKAKALPAAEKIDLARQLSGRKINTEKAADRAIETEATTHLRALEGSAFFGGFPIPTEWFNAMSRWILGSPRGPDPNFQPDTDPNPHNQRDMPAYGIAKKAAATQLGARIHTDAEKATTAYSYLKQVGEQVAGVWHKAHTYLDNAFPVAPDGSIALANGTRGFMSDVVEAEMRRPGSQPLTAEQRDAVQVWKDVLTKQLQAMERAGVKKFFDDQGNVLSIAELLNRGYMPRTVKPKTMLGQAWDAILGRKSQTMGVKPGTRPGFRKQRVKQSEEEGVQGGVQYVESFSQRVADFIKNSNREIADHGLANDPLLGGIDRVMPLFRKLIAERKSILNALSPADRTAEIKRLKGLATQAATGNVFVAPAFRGKEYSPEVKRHLEMMFGVSGGPYLRFAQALSQELRNLVLSVDMSAATLQLQGMLFSNPARWAKSMKAGFTELFNPGVLERAAQSDPLFRKAMEEIAQAGGNLGRPEQIATLGGGQSITERIPGYARFGKSFETVINMAKVELWRANRPANPAEWPRTIEAIENSLGSGRMEQLGMSPERAFLERLLFLAPSYYRGYMKSLLQATQRGAAGFTARKQLGALASGVLLTSIAALHAAAQAGWISDEELEERLNPERGKFLMVPIPMGDKRLEIGFGGFYVSMTRTLSNMAKDQSIRPAGRWYRGHAGMLPRAAADVGTGRDYFGNPISAPEALGRTVLPVAAQQAAFEQGSPQQRAGNVAAGLVGLRSFPPSEKAEYIDRLRRFTQEKTGRPYSALSLRERAALVRQYDRVEKPPKVPTESRQVAQERAAAIQAERQQRLMKAVSPDTRRTLDSLGKTLPSYDASLALSGTEVPMTRNEMERYESLLTEQYNKAIATWPVERLRGLPENRREDFMRRSLERAKEIAKRKLLAPRAQ